jgi:FixJ family two-component response regulator
MTTSNPPAIKVALLDPDARRRARIAFHLSARRIHVEPFECSRELAAWPLAGCVILVHEDAQALEHALLLAARPGEMLPVVVFGSGGTGEIVAALRCGARDYIAWNEDPDNLAKPLVAAAFQGASGRLVAGTPALQRLSRLTRREREVLDAAALGLTSRTTGERLAISPRTVEAHRANVMSKLGVRQMAEAVRMTRDFGEIGVR